MRGKSIRSPHLNPSHFGQGSNEDERKKEPAPEEAPALIISE
jgi:hypothetical protein